MNDETIKIKPNESMVIKAARKIQDLIHRDFSNGGQLPSEPELSKLLGVNRGTVRQALNILEQTGFVTRKHGSGTYVNANVLGIKMRLDNPFDLLGLMQSKGAKTRDELLDVSKYVASDELMTKFEPGIDPLMLRVSKRFFMNEEPAIFLEDYISVSRFKFPIDDIDFRQSIFDVLDEYCSCRISYGVLAIKPVVCGEQIGNLIGLKPSEPAIKLSSTYYDMDNVMSLFSIGYYNTELIELNVLRRCIL